MSVEVKPVNSEHELFTYLLFVCWSMSSIDSQLHNNIFLLPASTPTLGQVHVLFMLT